jgi:hypothetical protein
MPGATRRVEWVLYSRGFYRSADGRFDLVRAKGYWVAYDWELGKAFRHWDAAACESWCERQAEPQPDGE